MCNAISGSPNPINPLKNLSLALLRTTWRHPDDIPVSVIEAEWRKRTTAWFRGSQERGPQRQGDRHYGQLGAHARSEGLIVVTNNMKEFVRMPGVRVENRV